MPADVSRVRFDPRHHYANVLMQQGRVLLDADWNEYVEIVDRRLRAAAIDVASFGVDPDHAGTSWVPRHTIDGFRVTASGGELSIGVGRMYVDGLVAENHGVAPFTLDPTLGEVRGSGATPYGAQPHWPVPDPLPSAGTHLAYLDVWERELTHLEAPDLVEQALGVDTTARTQTVWQVRLLPDVGDVTCDTDDDDVPGWLDLTRPSEGRLSSTTIEVDDEEDPCLLPPTGGYRGLENQLYRVEIHDGGPAGTATFKWSRDNGSVAVPVVEVVSPTVLRIATVGRDDVLRVSTGDWVEIIDDHAELDRRPGAIRKVTVDDGARTITFTPALPADLQPATAEEASARHLRVRRWDQSGTVRDAGGGTVVDLDQPGASGLISVPAAATTQVVLEHGIVVSFSVAATGGRFRAGDHWVFAARTNDTSIEELDAAPPLGVHHHYARLAVVTMPGSATDCRRLWPPLDGGDACGDCTACVTPESHRTGALTVQAALDQVREHGGTVCLHEGTYDLGDGVVIDRARSVRLRGQGPATVLVARGTAVTVHRSAAVFLERFAVLSGAAASGGIRLHTAAATIIDQVAVLSYADREKGGGPAVELVGACMGVTIRESVLVGNLGIDSSEAAAEDRTTGAMVGLLRVVDNEIVGRDGGVHLGGVSSLALACRIEGNDVVARGGSAITATGIVNPGGSLSIGGNRIGSEGAGIVVGPDAAVLDNTINGVRDRPGTDGIVVLPGDLKAPPGHVTIAGNRVHDRSGVGIALRGRVRSFVVTGNVVTGVGMGVVTDARGRADRLVVDGNEITGVTGTEEDGSAAGIALFGGRSVSVTGNRVRDVGADLVEGRLRSGILVAGSTEARISGNAVDAIGPRGEHVGLAVGILASGPFDVLRVTENDVRDGVDQDARRMRRWSALLVQSAGTEVTRFSNGDAVVPSSSGAMFVRSDTAAAAEDGNDHVTVADNALAGGNRVPTCLVSVRGDVVATGNQCDHDVDGDPTAMLLRGAAITASSNRIRAGKAGLVLDTAENTFAAVGNLAPGGTHLGSYGNGLFSPWDALNPNA